MHYKKKTLDKSIVVRMKYAAKHQSMLNLLDKSTDCCIKMLGIIFAVCN